LPLLFYPMKREQNTRDNFDYYSFSITTFTDSEHSCLISLVYKKKIIFSSSLQVDQQHSSNNDEFE
jgi:hypothetical protein